MRSALPLLFALLAPLAGCDTRVLEDSIPMRTDADELMPLEQANRWTYRMTLANGDSITAEGELEIKVAGEARLGQNDFARLQVRSNLDLPPSFRYPTAFEGYLRDADDGLVMLPPDVSEKFVYRYPVESGVSYHMPDIGSRFPYAVATSVRDVTVPAGAFECLVYTTTTPDRPTRRDFFAPGLGLVRREVEGLLTLELLAYDLQPSSSPDG